MNKLNLLLKSGESLFHTQDLALLWGIQNRNTLYVTISRHIKKGILIKVFKGLYSVVELKNIPREVLGSKIINRYSYISCQTIFEWHGVINQVVYPMVFMTSVSRTVFLNDDFYFIYKQLKPEFLNNREGVENKEGYNIATLERAVADVSYLNSKFYFDSPNLIDWDRVRDIQKKVGYKVTERMIKS